MNHFYIKSTLPEKVCRLFDSIDHQNFNGVHPELGNVIVSLRKESLYFPEAKSIGLSILYRAIFRTEEVNIGFIIEIYLSSKDACSTGLQ